MNYSITNSDLKKGDAFVKRKIDRILAKVMPKFIGKGPYRPPLKPDGFESKTPVIVYKKLT